MTETKTLRSEQMLLRVAGYGSLWLWTILMFHSTTPYAYTPDPFACLYASFSISLITMVIAMVIIAAGLQDARHLKSNAFIIGVSALAMTAGSVLTNFCDPDTSFGMGILMLSGILTGAGSAILFLCWGECYTEIGGRRSLLELAAGSASAFLANCIILLAPTAISAAAIVFLPLLTSASLLYSQRITKSVEDSSNVETPDRLPLSRASVLLLAESLVGAFLVGCLSGLLCTISGSYLIENSHLGWMLLLVDALIVLVFALITYARREDTVLHDFRFTLVIIAGSCLLLVFQIGNDTAALALAFAGYTCFIILLYVLCADAARSFRIGASRSLGLGFMALYGGEAIGHWLYSEVSSLPIDFISAGALAILFIAHLYLFNEANLIKLGLGELEIPLSASEKAPSMAESIDDDNADPATIIIDRYHLTPRESEVLPLVLDGRSIGRIQETLFISSGTVSTHMSHIYQKTGTKNRQELLDLAQQIASEHSSKS